MSKRSPQPRRRSGPIAEPVALSPGEVLRLRRAVLDWYGRTARVLPWRTRPEPYAVWVSEIMLQQTQVATVLPYFDRFLRALPTVEALAAAPVDAVLKLWEGLGYYSRARNLHRAAQMVVGVLGGRFPECASEWERLPGVGRYTACAIASITRGEPVAVVDGNVKRVLARLLRFEESIDDPRATALLWPAADALLDPAAPGDFNQAMMELGARICTPRRPTCETCPVATMCRARAAGVQAELPVRRKKRPAPRVDAVAVVVARRGRYLFVRRPSTGLLAGLWGWPMAECARGASLSEASDALRRAGIDVQAGEVLGEIEHVFTHRRLYVRVIAGRVACVDDVSAASARWLTRSEIAGRAIARVDGKICELLGLVDQA